MREETFQLASALKDRGLACLAENDYESAQSQFLGSREQFEQCVPEIVDDVDDYDKRFELSLGKLYERQRSVYASVLAGCATCSFHSGLHEQALKDCKLALLARSDSPEIHCLSASIYIAIEQHDLARTHVEKAIKLDPHNQVRRRTGNSKLLWKREVSVHPRVHFIHRKEHTLSWRWNGSESHVDPALWQSFAVLEFIFELLSLLSIKYNNV